MADYTITAPNTCALSVGPDNSIVYVEGVGVIVGTPDDRLFTEYLTSEDAAAAALVINPSYDLNNIYGPLALTSVNVSPYEESRYVGDSVTLHCEYACEDATVSYQWKNPGELVIPGATSSHLTLNNLTEKMDGVYACNVSASNAKGQTGSATGTFKVTVYPPIEPGGVAE
jgi:hypothetical protein